MRTPKTITSPSNDLIKAIRALERRKERKQTGLFVAEGLRHVIEGLDNGWQIHTLVYGARVAGRGDVKHVRARALHAEASCLEVSDAVLEKLSHKDNPQQVIGVFKQRRLGLDYFETHKPKNCLVALEQVRDGGNLGTIIRTADGAGADGVILIDQCCDIYAQETVRATMGSLFAVPVVHCNQDEFIAFSKAWDGCVVGTHLTARTVDYREMDYTPPTLLVMGNEQAGLSEPLTQALPHLVKLPMAGRADSLNLAIATGIMLYKVMH